jgi:serine/threonine protein kinase
MVEPQASRFWHAALKSGLIDEPALRTCWEAIPPEKRTADAIDRRLARQTVTKGYLSLWQAQQIHGGRSQGFQIGKYQLVDLIGQGGMGRVYLAKDIRLDRLVALKVLSPERMNNPRAIARFQREARVGAQLQHENLVRIYDEGEQNGVCYLVMEYIEGKSVGELLTEAGAMPAVYAAEIARQVALGLEHAHRKGLVHRDVNPWNILVSKDGKAKLTDLGLAIIRDERAGAVTRDGATVGTFDYLSPEQAKASRSAEPRSDIYSLGCTLYHMISGQVPFPAPSLPEKLYAHQLQEPEPLSARVPGVPEGLEEVICRMMKKAPEERYATAAEVARALEPFSEGGLEAPTALPPLSRSIEVAAPAPPVTVQPPADAFLLSLDLGPEPPLSDSLSGVREPVVGPVREWGRWLGLGAAVVLVMTMLGLLAVRGMGRADPDHGRTNPLPATKPLLKTTSIAAIAVLWPDGSLQGMETGDPFQDLKEAISTASGKRGAEVVLQNTKPMVLNVTKALVVSGGGDLVVRSARNTGAALLVQMVGKDESFLRVTSDTALKLQDLTIAAQYPEPKSYATPLIHTGGTLVLDHCAFSAPEPHAGTVVAFADGKMTKIDGCWFEGFDHPLQAGLAPGSKVDIHQCIFVCPVAQGWMSGWPLIARQRGAGPRVSAKAERQVSLRHCTALGRGLMVLRGFSTEAPVTVTVQDTVVRTEALLMWKSPEADYAKALIWSASRNRYAISGAAWVIAEPKAQGLADAMPNSPDDLESWIRVMPDDHDSEPKPVAFPADHKNPAEPRQPKDFAVSDKEGHLLGADPAQVGPRSPGPKA